MANAFTEPTDEKKRHILSQMHRVDLLPEDERATFEEIINSIHTDLDTKVRAKTSMIPDDRDAGQHHYFGIRALNTPERSRIDCLAGEEFFGVNRFIDELIDVGDVQWWAVYDNGGWGLHTRCALGEHLETWGSKGSLKSAVIMVNGMPLSVDETISFYRIMKKRQRNGFSRRFSSKKFMDALKKISEGKKSGDSDIAKLEEFGLVENGKLTYAGKTLITEQEAKTRKEAVEKLRSAIDSHGLRNEIVGAHGAFGEISDFLTETGIRELADNDALTEAEIIELKVKDRACSRRFGFSVLQQMGMYALDPEAVQNSFLKILAKELPPSLIRGNIGQQVVKLYKKQFPDYKKRIKSHISKAIRNADYEKLAMKFLEVTQAIETAGFFTRKELEAVTGTVIEAKLRPLFNSPLLEERYKFPRVVDSFSVNLKRDLRKNKKEIMHFAESTLRLFKKNYAQFKKEEKIGETKKFVNFYHLLGLDLSDALASFMFESVRTPETLDEMLFLAEKVSSIDFMARVQKHAKEHLRKVCRLSASFAPYISVFRRYTARFHLTEAIPEAVRAKAVADYFDSLKAEYSSLAKSAKKERLSELSSFANDLGIKIENSQITQLIFSAVHDADSLDYALSISRGGFPSKYPTDDDEEIRKYFSAVCSNKSGNEKVKALFEYADVIRERRLQKYLPKDVNCEDLEEKAFFASLFPGQADRIISEYDSFKKLVNIGENEVVFVDLLTELEKPLFEKFSRHIRNNGTVALDESGKRVKVTNSFSTVDITNFVQAAVFLSYLHAIEKGETVVYDANAVYIRKINTKKVMFGFGKEEPVFEYPNLRISKLTKEEKPEFEPFKKLDYRIITNPDKISETYLSNFRISNKRKDSLEEIIKIKDYFSNKSYNI